MMPNFRLPSSICKIPSSRVFQNQPPCWLSSDSDSGKTGGGGFLLGLGSFRREKWGRVCGYSRWLSQYFCSRVDGLDPLPLGESFSSVRGVFLTFARVLESHLCHKTGVLYWALVSMLRACIDLRVIHSSGKAPRLTPAHFIAEQV